MLLYFYIFCSRGFVYMHMHSREEEGLLIENVPLTETTSGLQHHCLQGRGSSQRWARKLLPMPVLSADGLPFSRTADTNQLVPPSGTTQLSMASPRFGQGESSPRPLRGRETCEERLCSWSVKCSATDKKTQWRSSMALWQ